MTVYVTGDIHGGLDMQKLRDWDLGDSLTSDDYLIVAGDFGFPWDFSAEECADIAVKTLDRRRFGYYLKI